MTRFRKEVAFREVPGGIAVPAEDFSLPATLQCGQCFRWKQCEDGTWQGAAMGKRLTLREENGEIVFSAGKEEFLEVWVPYFDLELDYGKIRRSLARKHPVLREACRYAPGIRILRQDPWEALCSFIISQNNNIPRIQGIISRLCELYGGENGGNTAFPPPEWLAELSVEDLAPLRSGFRAKYLLSAARLTVSGEVDLTAAAKLPVDEAREMLRKIYGVGDKVADCVLLYGLHRLEAFPMDVWMKRTMAELLPGVSPEDLGSFAGIAQQYLFHYSRNHPELFRAEGA